MLIERIGAVPGYNSHKEIDFGAKLALPALLADFRIKRLIDNGTRLSLFTNGMLLDNIFANKIKSRLLKDGISVGLNIPDSPADLVNIIASYRCIIAARLHSCIVAYSLGIPAIGFVWNDKLKLWGENIHAEEFFVDVDNLTVDFLVDKMKKLLEYKYDSIAREQFRDTVQIDISQLAKDYFSPDFESKKTLHTGGDCPKTIAI